MNNQLKNFSSQTIGDITELYCILECKKLGYSVSIPYGNNDRYDFILDTSDKLYRVQCKTSHYIDKEKTAFNFPVHNQRTNTKTTTRKYYDKNQIDVVATYINNNAYFIPIEECSNTSQTLRLLPGRNVSHHEKYAKKYLINNFLSASYNSYEVEDNIQPKKESSKKDYRYLKFIKSNLHECKICKQLIKSNTKICPQCKTNKKCPSRNELKNLIRNESFLDISKKIGVTENCIRNWCRNYGLPDRMNIISNMRDEEWNDL